MECILYGETAETENATRFMSAYICIVDEIVPLIHTDTCRICRLCISNITQKFNIDFVDLLFHNNIYLLSSSSLSACNE